MKKNWKSTTAILNIGDKGKTITLLWLKLIAFAGYNERRRETNSHYRATSSGGYDYWAHGERSPRPIQGASHSLSFFILRL